MIYRYLLCVLIITTCAIPVAAQIHLDGVVRDATSLTPIPFAHVRWPGGVAVSNQTGHYSLTYRQDLRDSLATVSCVGYQTAFIALSELTKTEEILLQPSAVQLREVVVSTLSVQAILKRSARKSRHYYQGRPYLRRYTFDQQILSLPASDSALATARETGVVRHQSLDTTGTYPQISRMSFEASDRFVRFDTVANPLTLVSHQRNTFSLQKALSFDPLRIGLLRQFHAVPTLFSPDFYNQTDMRLQAVVTLDQRSYFLISIYPGRNVSSTGESPMRMAYGNKLKAMAAAAGRSIPDHVLDSLLRQSRTNTFSASEIAGYLLVDTETYMVAHVLIKVCTFSPNGQVYSQLHVSASYANENKRYFLQNLDILLKQTAPPDIPASLYYLTSLHLSSLHQEQDKPPSSLSVSPPQALRPRDAAAFLLPVRDCVTCPRHAQVLWGQVLD